jgi:hypothetical protein
VVGGSKMKGQSSAKTPDWQPSCPFEGLKSVTSCANNRLQYFPAQLFVIFMLFFFVYACSERNTLPTVSLQTILSC